MSEAKSRLRRTPVVNPRRERYVQQFQVAVLELERKRRDQERHALLHKLWEIDLRLRELKFLIDTRYAALGLRSGEPAPAGARGTAPDGNRVEPGAGVIRY